MQVDHDRDKQREITVLQLTHQVRELETRISGLTWGLVLLTLGSCLGHVVR